MQLFLFYIFLFLSGAACGIAAIIFWPKVRALYFRKSSERNGKRPSDISRLYDIAESMQDYFQKTANPIDVLDSEDFLHGVKLLEKSSIPKEKVIQYGEGNNNVIACMAYRALLARELNNNDIDQIIESLDGLGAWPYHFAVDVLSRCEKPVLGAVLAKAQEWWVENKNIIQATHDFIKKRIEKGDAQTFASHLDRLDEEDIFDVETFLQALDTKYTKPFLDEIKRRKASSVDTVFLNIVGRVWNSASFDNVIIQHKALEKHISEIESSLFHTPERSVLIVGESGVGKSALLQLLFKRLHDDHWHIFQASAVDIIAGQVYIGELEERIQNLIKKLHVQKRVLWYIPDFHQIVYTGRHRFSSAGILDMILPYIESGKIKVIGELHPAANEQVGRDNKRVHSIFSVHLIDPLDDNNTMMLAQQWVRKVEKDKDKTLSPTIFSEALHLAKQFLNSIAPPGNLLYLLKMAQRRLLVEGRPFGEMRTDDLYIELSHLTGLPRDILDDQRGLDPDALRELFHKRVMGQNEAIDCLVERVAMIKAGLTDPTRPFGVFLFAGPTGTGKTEIAKTLAEFLFGSPDRMIRLDMSEFQAAESVDRILGRTATESQTKSLASLIREQPFSVLLLDEFEKANTSVWDLFLQVFDDGRLTDKGGTVSDFRHSIIIMTSNLGAKIGIGASIGFENAAAGFSLTSVKKSISQTFRREFLNRIDRVVIFNPLDRSTMRKILYKELNDTLQRRGLRTKEWAVEWEESAINFLLEKGFTPDLGARPLKRAIERYLLAPLALTIVNHQFPEGDQFLFVKSDGRRIHVEFIDPDAGETEEEHEETERLDEKVTLKTVMLEPQRTSRELSYLESCYEALEKQINNPAWHDRKDDLLAAMSAKKFWDSPERFKTLGDIELMDRIESGLSTAESLISRIEKNTLPRNLVARLAQQLYLLNEAYNSFMAKAPQDAFIKIESKPKSTNTAETMNFFALQLKDMYINWAKKRLMKYELLNESIEGALADYTCIIAISGFAAYTILEAESGMHVLENMEKDKHLIRHNIRVQVAPQAAVPEANPQALLAQARTAFQKSSDKSRRIIRRYQVTPTPLVRDNIRKWRTGRLDRVLDGNFDVMG
ncbi:AAA family ATPase [candidate division KSB1 bacterium]|nr:AAA family ATPase [candidate division KSB1 bacterium]